MDSNKKIEKPDFLEAVSLVKNLDEDDKDELDFLWEKCDADEDGVIDGMDFFNVCDILVCSVKENTINHKYVIPSPISAFPNFPINKQSVSPLNNFVLSSVK